MPTSKPRLTITLDPHAYEVLSRLSAASGQSMSSVVVDILGVAIPSLERVVVVLERASTAPREVLDGVAAAVERAERDYLPTIMQAAAVTDLFIGEVSRAISDDVDGRDSGRPPAAPVAHQGATPAM